jgi:hypothetical protein
MRAFLLWILLAIIGPLPALAERHALVVGIDDYR